MTGSSSLKLNKNLYFLNVTTGNETVFWIKVISID